MTKKKKGDNDAYRVPAELTKAYYTKKKIPEPEGRPGDLLKFCLQYVYGVRGYQTELSEFLQIVRQTVFQWVKRGIPPERLNSDPNKDEKQFADFITDPKTKFYLPTNATLEDFERPREETSRSTAPERNQTLMDFLVDIVAYQGDDDKFGVETLDTISMRMKNVTSPHLFWKWAYTDGGIPVTYIEEWLRYAIELETFLIMPAKYHDPQVFASVVRRKMCVDESYFREFYKLDEQPAAAGAKTPEAAGAG